MSAQHHHSRKRSSSRSKPTSKGPKREQIEELHPTEDVPDIEGFDEWDLNEEIQRAIRNMDITKPTPIQALAIGPVLEGKDVIAKAETGTGKTLAFGAPMMSNMDVARSTVLGLVLCPTRELAQQVADVLKALGLPRGLQVALIVGGDPMQPQIAQLHAGAQVVVGTPGRVLDLYQQRFLSFPWTEVAILDEADKMFEIGFLDDIKKILSFLPDERQTLLFSATFPTEVLKLARESTTNPVELATQRGPATVPTIDQYHIKINSEDRPLVLTRLMEQSEESDVFLVFCERRTDVDRLLRRMERLPFQIKALHGGYDQPSRFRVMSAYRTGEVKALLATDVASRGLDVNHVTHVINFGVPRELEDYTHRIGRTGRAGRHGTAITFVPPEDGRRWRSLVEAATWDIAEMEAPGRFKQAPRRVESEDRGEQESRDRAPRGERGRTEEDRERNARDRPDRDRQDRSERQRGERQERDERPRSERSERQERDERPRRERSERQERDERPRRERSERQERDERPRRERSERQERDERPRRERSERPEREERPRTTGTPLSRWARASEDEIARRRAERAKDRGASSPAPQQREERPRRERSERPERGSRRPEQENSERGQRDERPARRERGRGNRSERPAREERESRDERPRPADRQRDERPQAARRERAERPARDAQAPKPRDRGSAPAFGQLGNSPESKPAAAPKPKPAPTPRPERKSTPEPKKPAGPSFGTGL